MVGSNSYVAVWGSGANDIWLVGRSVAQHWDGRAWTAVRTNTLAPLWGVWGSGPNDVWAVGEMGTIVHWNGVVWAPVASGGVTNTLRAVWGTGPNNVWAVGERGVAVRYQY